MKVSFDELQNMCKKGTFDKVYEYTEYDECTEGMDIIALKRELLYQYSMGYKSTDSYPQYLQDKIENYEQTKETRVTC